jgi:4-amino-4-deoxy-L-arabinose transferase-like glycosyltransferase
VSQFRTGWGGIGLVLVLMLIAYLPVMLRLPLRSTGDEKVYIAQAIEMAQNGTWYRQSLFGDANYYKGPLYYLLMRIGMHLFGATAPLAITYMNLLAFMLAAVALWQLVRRFDGGGDRATELLVPGLVVFAGGSYAHALAGQMEAMLIAAYAVFMALLGMAPRGAAGDRARLLAMLVAGLAGQLKSPVHSVLLGLSALLFWACTGELKTIVRRPINWLAAVLGVAACGIGYAPALIFDRSAFVASYIERETFGKIANGVSIGDAVWPLISSHIMPWLPLLLAALWIACRYKLGPAKRQRLNSVDQLDLNAAKRLLWLSLCMTLPTVSFFLIHPSRSGIYILPVLPAVALAVGVAWHLARPRARRAFAIAFSGMAILIALIAAAMTLIITRFSPFPSWWGASTSALILGGLWLSALVLVSAALTASPRWQVLQLLAAFLALYTGIGPALVALEAHEEADARSLKLDDVTAVVHHANLNKYLWSETGLQSFMLGMPTSGLYSLSQLESILDGGPVAVTVPDPEQLAAIDDFRTKHPQVTVRVHPWRRWRMQHLKSDGEAAWLTAWRTRSLAIFEREEWIVVLRPISTAKI